MNIRAWYGVDVKYTPEEKFNVNLDSLLELYSVAISQYFGFKAVTDVDELIAMAKMSKLAVDEELFLEWFEESGIVNIREIASYTSLTDEKTIAEIGYEKYILSEEMSFEYPEEVRSILISVAGNLFPRIKKIHDSINKHTFALSYFSLPYESLFDIPGLLEPDPYDAKRISYGMVLEAGAVPASSFI